MCSTNQFGSATPESAAAGGDKDSSTPSEGILVVFFLLFGATPDEAAFDPPTPGETKSSPAPTTPGVATSRPSSSDSISEDASQAGKDLYYGYTGEYLGNKLLGYSARGTHIFPLNATTRPLKPCGHQKACK